jgi:hypothetical protein
MHVSITSIWWKMKATVHSSHHYDSNHADVSLSAAMM